MDSSVINSMDLLRVGLQLLRIMDDCTFPLDSGIQVDVIYTDFEKAFDKVPHQRLLSTLEAYGLDANLISFIHDFLCNRRVGINNCHSQLSSVDSGIPQGSVLFLIYINDLVDSCDEISYGAVVYLYADDAKVYRTVTSQQDKIILQKVIDTIKHWCDKWLLRLNVEKCKVVSYSTK